MDVPNIDHATQAHSEDLHTSHAPNIFASLRHDQTLFAATQSLYGP